MYDCFGPLLCPLECCLLTVVSFWGDNSVSLRLYQENSWYRAMCPLRVDDWSIFDLSQRQWHRHLGLDHRCELTCWADLGVFRSVLLSYAQSWINPLRSCWPVGNKIAATIINRSFSTTLAASDYLEADVTDILKFIEIRMYWPSFGIFLNLFSKDHLTKRNVDLHNYPNYYLDFLD